MYKLQRLAKISIVFLVFFKIQTVLGMVFTMLNLTVFSAETVEDFFSYTDIPNN